MSALVGKEFAGIIQSGIDPRNRGRYEVRIDESLNLPLGEDTILCSNHIHKFRDTPSDEENSEGQYFPLHPGTRVIVKFWQENYNSGYIDRVISDYNENSMPVEISDQDKSEYYQLLRTVANDLFAVTKNTQSLPPNGIHLYFRKDKSVMIMDDQGIHIYSKDDVDYQIDGSGVISIGGKLDILVASDMNVSISGNCNLKIGGVCNLDASQLNFNCGLANVSTDKKEKAKMIPLNSKKV